MEHSVQRVAELVADLMAEHGFAFVEDDKIDALAATLQAFVVTAGLSAEPPAPGKDPLHVVPV